MEENNMVTITATFTVSKKDVLRESCAESLEDAISGELGWVHDSGIFLKDWSFVPEHEHPNGDRDGICPVCGAPIEYENREIEDDGCVCSWNCEKCGCSGSLSEAIVFDQHFDIFDAEGKRVLEGRTEGFDGYTAEKLGIVSVAATEQQEGVNTPDAAPTLAELEKALFIGIVQNTLAEAKLNASADSLYSRYVAAVDARGTWLMAQEAAYALAGCLEDGSLSPALIAKMEDADFLRVMEEKAAESLENAMENACHGGEPI